ncbi:MAG: sodium:calcium antiporter, partial [bacterium]|nr:sodium:calcium antiporter [bacterium]
LFAIFMFYIIALVKSDSSAIEIDDSEALPRGRAVLYTVVGLVGLVAGGRLLVNQAVSLATLAGLSEAVVGLTVVAIGTSLPELATSVVAAWRKQVDIAVGNVIGSNIFNVFLVLGVSSVIAPLPVRDGFVVDALVMIAATLFLFVALFLGKRGHIDRWQGILFVLLYFAYVTYLLL